MLVGEGEGVLKKFRSSVLKIEFEGFIFEKYVARVETRDQQQLTH